MKIKKDEYLAFCAKFNLNARQVASLAKFVKEKAIKREITLIKRHTDRLMTVTSKNEMDFLSGGLSL